MDTYSASSCGRRLEEFLGFLRDSVDSALEVNSRPALLSSWPRSSSEHGSGLIKTGFAGIDAPRAVFPTIAFTQNGKVCTVNASAEQFL